MKKFMTLAMLFAFAVIALAQDVPKKPEIIPASEATAPAESNIPVPEQKPDDAKAAMQQKAGIKAVPGKRRAKRVTNPVTPKKEIGKK